MLGLVHVPSPSLMHAWCFWLERDYSCVFGVSRYPTDTDKHMLATQTGLSRNQVTFLDPMFHSLVIYPLGGEDEWIPPTMSPATRSLEWAELQGWSIFSAGLGFNPRGNRLDLIILSLEL